MTSVKPEVVAVVEICCGAVQLENIKEKEPASTFRNGVLQNTQ